MSYSIDNKYNKDFLSFFSVLCLMFVWCFFSDNSAIVFCAGHEIPVETIVENTSPHDLLEPEKHKSFWSYKKLGFLVLGIIGTVAFFKFGGGDGSELLSAVGQAAPVEDIVPAVAAVAAVAAAAPAINIVVDATPSVFALVPAHHHAISTALENLQVSVQLRDLLLAGSDSYYNNFVDSLESPYTRRVLVDFMTEDSMSPVHVIFEQIQGALRFSCPDVIQLIVNYSRDMGINLLVLLQDVGHSSFARPIFARPEDFFPIVYILGFVGLKLLQDITIVRALVEGSGYEVLASSVIESFPWYNIRHLMQNSTPSFEALTFFSNLLMGGYQYDPNVDSFIVSNMEDFQTRLTSRDAMSPNIILNDSYILVMLLKDILKAYIDRGIHEWFMEGQS